MMRFQSVNPDCLPLSNGRKPMVRTTCMEDDPDVSSRIPSLPPFEGKVLRATHDHNDHDDHLPHASISSEPANAENPAADAAASGLKSQSQHEGSGDILLQWGHKKRTRGSRAESRVAAAGGDESLGQSRRPNRMQRRPFSGASMPPPCPSYSRGVNLRPATPLREVETLPNRAVQQRSGGPSRLEKRSPSPLAKPHRMASATESSLPNGQGIDTAMNTDLAHTPPSDPEIGSRGISNGAAEKVSLDQMVWPKIYVSLSRKEKEEDFLAMKGTKLPQRPKKRPKNVDKVLQYVFPGMWLSDLTRARYEVREKRCSKKVAAKRRGLKGMESMDSDSE